MAFKRGGNSDTDMLKARRAEIEEKLQKIKATTNMMMAPDAPPYGGLFQGSVRLQGHRTTSKPKWIFDIFADT